MSDSRPIYVITPRAPDTAHEAVNLSVEYPDGETLVRDSERVLAAGNMRVQTTKLVSPGTPLVLNLSFPGLVRPIRLTGVVASEGQDEGKNVHVEFVGLDAATRAALREHLGKIKERAPDFVVRVVRVLVVEDNPHCAKLIQEGLRLAGKRAFGNRVAFDVPMASNAADALTFLHSRPIEVLITDIYLGGVSGTTVIAHVRADPGLKLIPIIAISAGDETTQNAALKAGADVFLPKPVRLRQIVGTVGDALKLEKTAWR